MRATPYNTSLHTNRDPTLGFGLSYGTEKAGCKEVLITGIDPCRQCGGWLLPFFIKETSMNDFLWKYCCRCLPRLRARRDLYHSPVTEAREKQVIERGEFFFVEGMAAV